MRLSRWVGLLALIVWCNGNLHAALIGKRFPTLTLGLTTYTNAAVTDISGGTVSLRHAGGIASIRVDTLHAEELAQLGLEPNPANTAGRQRAETDATEPVRLEKPLTAGEGESKRPPWSLLPQDAPPLQGVAAVILSVVLVGAILLVVLGKILFIVAAFRTGPWWGVGVLLGGLTCGIVPLIYLCTHFEECKKPVLCMLGGFVLALGMAVAVPNFARAKAAAGQQTTPR